MSAEETKIRAIVVVINNKKNRKTNRNLSLRLGSLKNMEDLSTAFDPIFFFFFNGNETFVAILSYRRVGGSPIASKLPMFANTMIAGGL